jgi:death on curing protein
MRYPSYSELIFINGRILKDPAIQAGKKKVRDIDLLLAAAERPRASVFGEDAYPSLKEKAAALLHSIARNHPFADGNKRTATIGALFFLAINGERVDWNQQSALDRILNLAEGRSTMQDFAAWLKSKTGESLPEADTEADTRLIDELINEQKWLLNALSER